MHVYAPPPPLRHIWCQAAPLEIILSIVHTQHATTKLRSIFGATLPDRTSPCQLLKTPNSACGLAEKGT